MKIKKNNLPRAGLRRSGASIFCAPMRLGSALGLGLSMPVALSTPAVAQESDFFDLGTLVFSASRRSEQVEDIPRSVVVVTEEQIERTIQSSENLSVALGRLVPGYSAPDPITGGGTSATLRGRQPLFLVDGIRMGFNQNFGQFLNTLDPGIVERVEVIYGPSALYGQGAAGGVIQIFTKRPTDTQEAMVRLNSQSYVADENAFDSDGTSTRVSASLSNTIDRFGYYSYISFEDRGGVYNADGNLTAPDRLQFADNIQFFGKTTYALTDTQTLTFSFDYYDSEQTDDAFRFSRTTGSEGFEVVEPSPTGDTYSDTPSNESTRVNLTYDNTDVFGGVLRLQGYYRENRFLNPGSDIADLVALPPFAEWPRLWQTGQDGDEYGLRGEFTRDLGNSVVGTFGFDYAVEDYRNILIISDPTVYDATGLFDASSEDVQSPPYVLDTIGLFAQFDAEINDRTSVTAGVRYDRFSYDVDPYDVVFNAGVGRGQRPGGSGSSDNFSFNLGANYQLTDATTLFANYSQGFLVPAIGLAANRVEVGQPLQVSSFVEPIDVESFELGLRGQSGQFGYAAAAFYSESDLGNTVSIDSATGLGNLTRSPQRNYGFELAGSWQPTDQLNLSGSFSWQEGEFDPNDTGDYVPINSLEVSPPKLVLNADYRLTPEWTLFGQVLSIFERDRAFDEGQDRAVAEAYTLMDVGATYSVENFDLSAQITNLFNENYAPVGQSVFIPGRRRKGPGRALWITATWKL